MRLSRSNDDRNRIFNATVPENTFGRGPYPGWTGIPLVSALCFINQEMLFDCETQDLPQTTPFVENVPYIPRNLCIV
jgi:hypothetical protein